MKIFQTIVILSVALTAGITGGVSRAEGIGYATVDAAITALKSSKTNKVSISPDGWTIVSEGARGPLWSFTPPKHPAHPAAVKRVLVEKNGSIVIAMSALCQASKSACDALIEEFKLLNNKIAEDTRSKTAGTDTNSAAKIVVERIDDNAFRLVLTSKRSTSVEAGQLELMPKASEVCGARFPSLGKYQFELDEPVATASDAATTLLLRQDIACELTDTRKVSLTAPLLTPDIVPSIAEDQRAQSATLTFFSLLEGAKYKEAYDMQSEALREAESLSQLRDRSEKFNAASGTSISRKIKKVTWYRDPPGLEPGNYAAVDFLSSFKNIPYACGYLVWKDAGIALQLLRQEINVIDAVMVKALRPEELEAAITRFKCR